MMVAAVAHLLSATLAAISTLSPQENPGCPVPASAVAIEWPGELPPQGALHLRFQLVGLHDTLDLPTRSRGETSQAILFDTPLVQANLNVERNRTAIHFFFPADPANNGPWVTTGLDRLKGLGQERELTEIRVGVLELSRLRGDQWYDLSLLWDLKVPAIRIFLNGIEQGDIFAGSPPDWTPLPSSPQPARAGGVLQGNGVEVPIAIARAFVQDSHPLPAALKAQSNDIPLLREEGRVIFSRGLDFQLPEQVTTRRASGEEIQITRESDLFSADRSRRIRRPLETEWVLEGSGEAFIVDGKLTLQNIPAEGEALSATAQRGHQVLWIPWEAGEHFLFEYDFVPEDSNRGLHIIFWNASAPGGASIFDPERTNRFRDAVFSEYLWRGLRSYHASIFATDDTTPRRVANLRRNPGFYLAACGNDVIGGAGPGPFRVRLLREGTRMQIEVDGEVVMDFNDDGRIGGPAHQGGILGFRIMAHTGRATFSNIKFHTWEIEP